MRKLTEIASIGSFRLRGVFSDGQVRDLDCTGLLAGQDGPLAQPLKDPSYFGRVFLDQGAPTWPNGYDMSPDWFFAASVPADVTA